METEAQNKCSCLRKLVLEYSHRNYDASIMIMTNSTMHSQIRNDLRWMQAMGIISYQE